MTQQEFIERYHYDATRDLLGKGGFGRVYRAYDREEHEYVAIKMQSVDPDHPELRLRNEFEKVQQCRHRYIARYKECYTFSSIDGEKDVAIMKYYKDGSLDALIKSKKLDLEARFVMLRQILEGIAFLHSHGIIHRDLKPQNILIAEYDGTYEPLITDFGISKQLADGESSAVSNSILGGTYSYASPEQLKETTIRKNTDLWSFGIIAYQMLTGALPFNCGTFSPTSQEGRQEQFRQMTSGVLPEALNNIPEPWQTLIRECLVVDNTQRIGHVEDCMAILNNQPEDVTVDESTIVETPVEVEVVAEPVKEEVKPRIDTPKQKEQPKSNIPTEPTPKNSEWLLWLLLLLFAVGGVVGYMMSGSDEPEPTPSSSTGGENVVNADSICEVQPKAARPAPTFTLDKSSLTVDSSGGSHSVGYTIEHPIDGASVSVSDNKSWITNPSASGGKITFKTTDNTSTESRTGTITATYNGITRQITVTQKGADYININGHYAVDLGLSVKWATCNVGATNPEDYGNYYAWGETTTKTSYTEDNSKTWDKDMGDIGGHSRYDAATANWGSGWRMPTKSEFDELIDNCTWTLTTRNGVEGYEVKSKKNGNSIFLPAAGYCYGDTPDYEYQGCYGCYWSSTPYDTYRAYRLGFDIGGRYTSWNGRYWGQSVRPVAE